MKYHFQSIVLGLIGNLQNVQCLVELEQEQELGQKVSKRNMEEYVQGMLQNKKIAIHRIVQVQIVFETILIKLIILILHFTDSH